LSSLEIISYNSVSQRMHKSQEKNSREGDLITQDGLKIRYKVRTQDVGSQECVDRHTAIIFVRRI